MDFGGFVQTSVTWVMLAGVYGLLAIGITLIFSVMRIIHFAYGGMFTLGAFGVFFLTRTVGIDYPWAVLPAALVLGVLSMGLERTLFRPLRQRADGTLLMTFGLALLLEGLVLLIFGANFRTVESPVSGSVDVGGVIIVKDRVLVFAISALAIALVFALLRWTKLGNAMRAVAQDHEAAALQGIPIDRIYQVGFGIGSGLGALAGGLLAPLYFVLPSMGTPWLIKAFIVIILGGLGNVAGAVVGAVVLAFIDSFGTFFFGSGITLIAFILVILIVMVRPQGLIGART